MYQYMSNYCQHLSKGGRLNEIRLINIYQYQSMVKSYG